MDYLRHNQRSQSAQRPTPSRQPVQQTPPVATASVRPSTRKRRYPTWMKWVLPLAAALVVAGVVAWSVLFAPGIERGKYQAVFLSNGQVYFGKLRGYHGARPYLEDVYYFQANQNSEDEATQGDQVLIKLGDEIHKPQDKMLLNRDAILFVENLADDSQVVQTIRNR